RAPIVVILDDLHRAGAGLLRLLGLLMTDDEPKRVLVVVTARTSPPGDPSRLAQLIRTLDRIGTVDRVQLTRLTAQPIARLLADLAHRHAVRQAERLRELSNGNPFLLGELLQVGEFQTVDRTDDDTLELTDRMRVFVMQRIELLGQPLKELLQIAALVEGAFD